MPAQGAKYNAREEASKTYQEVVLWQSRDESRFNSLKKVETLSGPPAGESSQSMCCMTSTKMDLFIKPIGCVIDWKSETVHKILWLCTK